MPSKQLWDDDRIDEAVEAASIEWIDADSDWLWKKVRVMGAYSGAGELLRQMRDDYEAKLDELERELAEARGGVEHGAT